MPQSVKKGNRIQQFQAKVEAETKAREKRKKVVEREKGRQEKIIDEKRLKNNFVFISFLFGLLGTLIVLWPAGYETQMQIWYIAVTFICGGLGYLFALKANKLNKTYYQRYHVIVQPKLSKYGLYLSSFTLFGGVILFMTAISF